MFVCSVLGLEVRRQFSHVDSLLPPRNLGIELRLSGLQGKYMLLPPSYFLGSQNFNKRAEDVTW